MLRILKHRCECLYGRDLTYELIAIRLILDNLEIKLDMTSIKLR